MLLITENIQLPLSEISLKAIRAKGPGGQHVNKVSSALQLTFDITASSLPVDIKKRLLNLNDHRVSNEGVITIKAQDSRSQIQNREIDRKSFEIQTDNDFSLTNDCKNQK